MLQFTITHTFLGPLITGLQIMEGVWQFVNHNIINFPIQKWYNCNDEHLDMIFSITMNAFESLTDCSLCHTNCKIIFFSQQCNGTGKTGENMSSISRCGKHKAAASCIKCSMYPLTLCEQFQLAKCVLVSKSIPATRRWTWSTFYHITETEEL